MDHYICDVGMFKQQKLSYVQPRIVGCHWYKESSQTSGSNKLQLSHDLWVRKMSFHSISNHGSFFPDRDCPIGICNGDICLFDFKTHVNGRSKKKRCPSNRMLRSLQWHGLSLLSAISLAALIWTTWTSWDSHLELDPREIVPIKVDDLPIQHDHGNHGSSATRGDSHHHLQKKKTCYAMLGHRTPLFGPPSWTSCQQSNWRLSATDHLP